MHSLERPNVLLITTDQQRQDSMGCYGNPLARTPHLDRLAAEGVRFDDYHVNNPVCMPSRMSLLTGRSPGALGIGTNGISLPEETPTLATILSPYGYETAQIGKLHFQPHARRCHRDPHPRYGFDTFILSDEPGCYDDAYIKWVEAIAPEQVAKCRCDLPPVGTQHGQPSYYEMGRKACEPYVFEGDESLTHSAFVASETCRFLRRGRSAPFFAIAGFYAPHMPINPPQRFVDMFDPADMPDPAVPEGMVKDGLIGGVPLETWKKARAYYLALVAHVDDCVGQILQCLEETGQAENTLVLFTSDHGEYIGDHALEGKGPPGFDVITRVPMVVRFPKKLGGGRVVGGVTEGLDVAPTVLDYCGVQTPRFFQGESWRPLLEGAGGFGKDDTLMEHFNPHGTRWATVKTTEYAYGCTSSGDEMLLHRPSDPHGLRNLSGDTSHAEALHAMRKRLLVRMHASFDNTADNVVAY